MIDNYIDYAKATFNVFLSMDEKKDAYTAEATYMQSVYIENQENSQFKVSFLPIGAQLVPVFEIMVTYVNQDKNLMLF